MYCRIDHLPGCRYIGKGNVVISDAPQAGQYLSEWRHDQVLSMPANLNIPIHVMEKKTF